MLITIIKTIVFFTLCAAIGLFIYWLGKEYGIAAAYVGGLIIATIGITHLEPSEMEIDP